MNILETSLSQSPTCLDVNECTAYNDTCDQICNNTIGSFICSCRADYQLIESNNTCVDINECLNLNKCPIFSTCTNTIGSYYCKCNDGFYQTSNF